MSTASAAKRPPRRRCDERGCTNFARSASDFCAVHKRETARRPDGQTASGETFADRMAREDHEQRREAAAEFRARVQAGDYRGLFGGHIAELMAQAAAEGGVDDEIGILRVVMARLMAEEHDPVTLAKAISRVAAVSIQAARTKRAINGQLAEGLSEAITTILSELERAGE